MKRKWKLLLLWVLGFAAACDDEPQLCMYGTPHVDLGVRGRVTDASGRPIPGIEVGQVPEHPSIPFNPAASTDADGRYEINTSAFSIESLSLRFVDPDGEANGGDFASQELHVAFSREDRVGKGDGGWYGGSFARSGVDAVLELKEPAAEAEPDAEE